MICHWDHLLHCENTVGLIFSVYQYLVSLVAMASHFEVVGQEYFPSAMQWQGKVWQQALRLAACNVPTLSCFRDMRDATYRAFSCDVTVTWKPYGRPFWCTVEWRLSMLQVAHAKCSPNLTADGLTSQVCSISLPGTCYMWDVSALAA